MSARTGKNDLILARGDFEHTLYAILARSQREVGGVCTFGLEMRRNQKGYHPRDLSVVGPTGSSFKLGKLVSRGTLNYRWPFHEFALKLNEDLSMDFHKEMWAKIDRICSRIEPKREIKDPANPSLNYFNIVDCIYHSWRTEGNDWKTLEHQMKGAKVTPSPSTPSKVKEPYNVKIGYKAKKESKVKQGSEVKESQQSKRAEEEVFFTIVEAFYRNKRHPRPQSRLEDAHRKTKDPGVSSSSKPNRRDSNEQTKPHPEPDREVGTCVFFSFAKDATVYQVLRIEQGCWPTTRESKCFLFPDNSQISLCVGGPVRFASASEICDTYEPQSEAPGNSGDDVTETSEDSGDNVTKESQDKDNVTKESQDKDNITKESQGRGEGVNKLSQGSGDKFSLTKPSQYTVKMRGKKKKRANSKPQKVDVDPVLEARVYQVVDCKDWKDHASAQKKGASEQDHDSAHTEAAPGQCYEPLKLERTDAGSNNRGKSGAYQALVKLPSKLGPKKGKTATFLAALRLVQTATSQPEQPWKVPTSRVIYDYVGSSSAQQLATAAMWETLYLERSSLRQSFVRQAEVHLIARSLEKILQVDLVPLSHTSECAHLVNDAHPSALISNIFVEPALDYKSLL